MSLVRKIGKIVVPSAKLRGLIMNPYRLIRIPYEKYLILTVGRRQQKALKRIKGKKKVKVLFFMINTDTWKLNSIYQSFKNNNRFHPIVVICPFITKGQGFLENELIKGKEYCKKMDYEYFLAYDEKKLIRIDVKEVLKPDIVFFTNPNSLTDKEFLIYNFLDYLTCYVPYSFRIDTLYNYEYDNALVNLTWTNFYETQIHKNLSYIYARNKGRNVIVTGYPFMDNYKNKKTDLQDKKSIRKKHKKIIWAPHWTITGHQNTGLDWSCFLMFHKVFLELAKEFESTIQIILKPHPFLRKTLSQPSLWGIEKTEDYFNKWETLKNCKIVDGDYVDLFLEADALIHDSGSFMTEFLALNKPIAYTLNEKNIDKRFNDFGKIVFSGHYLIKSENNLRRFILNVINEIDNLIDIRQEIIDSNNLNPESLISNDIVEHITNKIK